jgi:ATP-binding cassette subfamily B protein
VDTETEEAILSALLPRLRGSTVILVSHRVSTLRNADRVVVLEGGRISQEGPPAELAARPGFYADILRLQQLEESFKVER